MLCLESRGCDVLRIDACATIGHSFAVHMPNQLHDYSQSTAHRRAIRTKLFGVDTEKDSSLANCTWNRDLVMKFACTYYFPPCSGKGTGLPPCRALCEGENFPFDAECIAIIFDVASVYNIILVHRHQFIDAVVYFLKHRLIGNVLVPRVIAKNNNSGIGISSGASQNRPVCKSPRH